MDMENKISIDEFKKVEIKVGKILSAEIVPDADKLLKLSVDFREDTPRQIVSGIRAYYPEPEKLVGISCMFVTNLEPRTIKGLLSNGMLFAVGGGEVPFSLLRPTDDVPPGTSAK